MDQTGADLHRDKLYVLYDGHTRFVGRLVDVRDGPNNTPLLEMEIVWAPAIKMIVGTHIPCLIRWVVREAVEEDYPSE